MNDRDVLDELVVAFGGDDQLVLDVVGAAGLLLVFLLEFALVGLLLDFGHVRS